MQNYSTSPKEMALSLYRNRHLIKALVRREVLGRYRGSFVGVFWSFLNPLLMLSIYSFVFGVVFKSRWGMNVDSQAGFSLVLFLGLIIFNIFSECINRAPGAILVNVNYVKKVVFPLEILPWVNLGSAIFHAAISLLVWILFYICVLGSIPFKIFLLPIYILPIFFLSMGISWLLASLGVYLRDLSQVTSVFVTVLLFLSPIFYPLSSLPVEYQGILELNPLTPQIEVVRDLLIFNKTPDSTSFIFYLAICMLISYIGFFWFQKTRKGFADVV